MAVNFNYDDSKPHSVCCPLFYENLQEIFVLSFFFFFFQKPTHFLSTQSLSLIVTTRTSQALQGLTYKLRLRQKTIDGRHDVVSY